MTLKDDHTLQLDMFLFMGNKHITRLVKDENIASKEKIRQIQEYVIAENLFDARYEAMKIHAELVGAIQDLNHYRKKLMDEIIRDVCRHRVFYTQFIGSDMGELTIAEILNRLSRQETLAKLKQLEEGSLLPRANLESSHCVNIALTKYRYATIIRNSLCDRGLAPQERIDEAKRQIEIAMPGFHISRDLLGMKLLKGLLAICSLFIAAPRLFDTAGRKMAAKQLSRLRFLQPVRQDPVVSDAEESSEELSTDSLSMTK